MPTPSQLDPTRTLTIRKGFVGSLNRIYRDLMRAVADLVVEEDAFGLKAEASPLLDASSILNNQGYSYSSTQVNVEVSDVLREVKTLQSMISPADHFKDELRPHITIRYGLFDQPGMKESVGLACSGFGAVKATLTKLSLFETDEHDVLKFDVESPDLERLNALLGKLPNYDKFPVYRPHMTVVYLIKGTGKKYVERTPIDGRTLTFDVMQYSDKEGTASEINLLVPQHPLPTLNKRWKYKTQEEAADEFEKWVKAQVRKRLLSDTQALRWRRYINRGFVKGASRALDEVRRGEGKGAKATRFLDPVRAGDFKEGKREEFLRTTLSKSVAAEKLRLLQSTALSEVRGLSDDLIARARRSMVESLLRNLSPKEAAQKLAAILKVSQGRARTIANTELVRAHAEGQLAAMEALGVEEVGVAVEWSSLASACPLCSPLNHIVLKLSEAKGMIPRHPNCRCAWTLANVGESKDEKKTQKRSKTKIDKAVKKSQKEGGDDWSPATDIERERPVANRVELMTFSRLMIQLGLL